MSAQNAPKPSLFEEICGESIAWWRFQPNKLLFGCLFIGWIVLFQFWGNITQGYVKTSSLFGWMYYVFSTSPDDEHGLLIPFVVLGLFWWKRKQLMEATRDVWWPGLLLFFGAVVVHLIGFLVQQTRVSIIAFFLGLYALLGLVWGRKFMIASFFPMCLFIFCVPLGTESERVTFPLRILATKITTDLSAGVFGLDVIRNGTQIFSPDGRYQYEVAAACSGIRSLTAIFAFTTIYGFICFQKTWRRSLVIFSAFPLAVASNVTRLLMIIFAAESFGQDAGNYVHDSSWLSLLPYIPAILGVMGLGRLLQEPAPTSTPAIAPISQNEASQAQPA